MKIRRAGLKAPMLALAATLLAVALGLAVLEIGIRILRPEATRWNLVARLKEERDTWVRPDSTFHHVGDGIFHLTFPAAGDTTQHRIMVVGDSFVMGHIVGEAARFGSLLQQRLGGKAKVDVLATSSYSPVIYRKIVRKALGLGHYDIVAVFVDQTDPGDELVYQQDMLGHGGSGTFDEPRMRHRATAVRDAYEQVLASVARWNSPRRLASLNFFKPLSILDVVSPESEAYYQLHQNEFDVPNLVAKFNFDPTAFESRVERSLLLRHLDQIVEMCRTAKVELVLTANPWEVQSARTPRVNYHFPPPYPAENRLEQLLADRYGNTRGVHVMPMTKAFREHPDPSSLFLATPANEIHWNEQGHAFVEGLLERYLLNELHIPRN